MVPTREQILAPGPPAAARQPTWPGPGPARPRGNVPPAPSSFAAVTEVEARLRHRAGTVPRFLQVVVDRLEKAIRGPRAGSGAVHRIVVGERLRGLDLLQRRVL